MSFAIWPLALLVVATLALPAAARDLRSCTDAPPPPPAIAAALDSFLAELVDPRTGTAPGASLLVRSPSWSFFRTVGHSDPDTGTPLACDAHYEIGSGTKMMTATVLLQLQEEGRLALDDLLAQHLPDIAAVLPFGDRITLRNLATHTSGLPEYAANMPDGALGIVQGGLHDPSLLTAGYAPRDLVAFAARHGNAAFSPGAQGQWAYSNTGYILLGLAIEAIEDKPLAEIFRERVFTRLALADTTLPTGRRPPEANLPRAWHSWPDGPEVTGWNRSQGWASSGVISTATDMADFVEGLLEGRLFVRTTTLEQMTLHPPERPFGIGLTEHLPGVWGHAGRTLGFSSDVAYLPNSATTIVLWTNAARAPGPDGLNSILGSLALALPDPNATPAASSVRTFPRRRPPTQPDQNR